MAHLVLLGDSIFDNAPYVASGQSLICYLTRKLPPDSQATLLAIDGSVTTDVPAQLRKLPPDATHLFLSVGGNDALQHIDYLQQRAQSVAEVVSGFAQRIQSFQRNYVSIIQALCNQQIPTVVCTIYEPSFEQRDYQTIASTAIKLWNDVIIQTAIAHTLPLLELRQVFTDPADYANPIEPSAIGSDKLSNVILNLIHNHDFSQRQTIVYGNP
jgi:lysophospholipase L1-like esterase